MVLREVAKSPASPAPIRASSSGVSLEQIKAAAAEAGLDPSLVERAARRLTKPPAPESVLARLTGGPRRYRETIHLSTKMSEKLSTRLLSAIRAAAEVPGKESADASGFSWHGWFQGNRLSVTAHEDSQGTKLQIIVDRGAPMVQVL